MLITVPVYGDAAIRRAGEAVTQQQLGDTFRIVSFGDRSAENATNVLRLKSDHGKKLPVVRKQVEKTLRELMERNRATGGQGMTDMTYSLENADIRCTPRSKLLILGDGLVETESYSTSEALASAQPVHLPPPPTAYLTGCTVTVLGVGMASTGAGQNTQTLPADQMRRLQAGLVEYFITAGVKPDAIRFASVL